MRIIGISAYYHDSAAAIIVDGEIIAAAQQERFSRIKHDPSFPHDALAYCLDQAGIELADVDQVVFYDKPLLKFQRLIKTYLSIAPSGFTSFRKAIPIWLKGKVFQKRQLEKALRKYDPSFEAAKKLFFAEHHQSHAASAFYPSPFDEAIILTMDGVGEWATSSIGIGRGNKIDLIREIRFPHSLGLLYSAFTYYTGFKVNSGEYKLMGLAPYGSPIYADQILENLVNVKQDGSFRLNMRYFNYCAGLTMTNNRFEELFGHPVRKPEEPLQQFHMDIAASIQQVTEHIILTICKSLATEFGGKNICLAGGVALNCVANGKLRESGCFDNIWIQPAAGDAGGAIGAALYSWHTYFDKKRSPTADQDSMKGSYLGPEYNQTNIEEKLLELGAHFKVLKDELLFDRVAKDLANERAFGWMQGRMEFGPRALGNRSIIADPRSSWMQKNLNLKVKFRESFRPFAPSVLVEAASDWFELDGETSPYMLMVANVKKERQRIMSEQEQALFGIEKLNVVRSEIPAVTHVDYSARIQTVDGSHNPKYYKLLKAFQDKTGCPVLVNTSFNVRGEPIVESPEDAFRCFMGTGLDNLVIGNCYLRKEDQPEHLLKDYKNEFKLD